MSGYPLKAVLDLRRREDEEAAARFADATRGRAAAEAEETRLIADVAGAQSRWDNARGKDIDGGKDGKDDSNEEGDDDAGNDGSGGAVTGAAATNRSRFVARRRDELERAERALGAFRSGPLARARGAEQAARDLHLAARLAREAFDKHAENFRAAERRVAERREEETLEEIARAGRHHPRGDRHS